MLPDSADYPSLYQQFRWNLPDRFNIGNAISTRWAREKPKQTAIVYGLDGEEVRKMSFVELDRLANKMANLLVARGVGPGDRVAVLLPQIPETAATHIAVYKIGAIAVPMAMLFGAEGLSYRLNNSGARAIVLSQVSLEKISAIVGDLPDLDTVISVDGGKGALDMYDEIAGLDDSFTSLDTRLDDPALMIYTSGTTGPPKGALHGHRVLLGHLPGVQFAHEFFPREGDMMWTPADWAWARSEERRVGKEC